MRRTAAALLHGDYCATDFALSREVFPAQVVAELRVSPAEQGEKLKICRDSSRGMAGAGATAQRENVAKCCACSLMGGIGVVGNEITCGQSLALTQQRRIAGVRVAR